MKILVIGGTQFIGRHLVERLLLEGHDVTLLNRGKTAPALFSKLQLIQVDRRSEDLFKQEKLKSNWDAVIDMSAYYPKEVSNLLQILNGHAGRYIQCSTLSSYIASSLDGPTPIVTEGSPLHSCSAEQAIDTSAYTYGARKAECERVAMQQHSSIPVVILRPCVVIGPYDHTDRFAHWVWRAKLNEPFILPEDGLTIIRRTYAPDLAQAFVTSLKGDHILGQAYNVAETDALSFRDTLHYLGQHLGTDPLKYAVSISSEKLLNEKVSPWSDLAFWMPKTNLLVDTFKSRRDLGFVSTAPQIALANTADDFLSLKRPPKVGMTRERELEILMKLK